MPSPGSSFEEVTIGSARLIRGDCRDVLAALPAESVHCCVTSPPYFGLRDYGVAGQIGLEATPAAYIANLVEIMRGVRRVLREDGTLWIVIGDSYNSGAQYNHGAPGSKSAYGEWKGNWPGHRKMIAGLKPKDLIGIPWMLAFALRDDGWYLRRDSIWHKPNPMPESVTDRPTSAHEYLFLFAKGQWKSRIIKFSDLQGERIHFGQYLGTKKPLFWKMVTSFIIDAARAILDRAELQYQIGLPPFYAKEWKQCAGGGDSDFVCGLPEEHRAAAWAARLFCAEASPKEFVREIKSLPVALSNSNNLLIGRVAPQDANAPSVFCYREATITVHNAGKVGKINFAHNEIIIEYPGGCNYFYDAEAIKEPAAESSGWAKQRAVGEDTWKYGRTAGGNTTNGIGGTRGQFGTRNKRSVWTIVTAPFRGAHFATFPPALVEPCILAGTSERGVCPKCGAPWERIVERNPDNRVPYATVGVGAKARDCRGDGNKLQKVLREDGAGGDLATTQKKTIGWHPTCSCSAGAVPATVLDPFAGASTTALVAERLGRRSVSIELSPAYHEIACERIAAATRKAEAA